MRGRGTSWVPLPGGATWSASDSELRWNREHAISGEPTRVSERVAQAQQETIAQAADAAKQKAATDAKQKEEAQAAADAANMKAEAQAANLAAKKACV